MVRTRVRRASLALALCALASLGLGFLAGRAGAGTEALRTTARSVYVVRAGDTVWSIARILVGRDQDPRPLVDDLIELNGIRDGLIAPGDRLRVP